MLNSSRVFITLSQAQEFDLFSLVREHKVVRLQGLFVVSFSIFRDSVLMTDLCYIATRAIISSFKVYL
jgi:hypothetical protein